MDTLKAIFDAIDANDIERVKTYLEEIDDCNQSLDGCCSPLTYATWQEFDCSAIMELLIEAGADIHQLDGRGVSPLASAVGDPAMMRFLLEKGASITQQCDEGDTALHYVALFDHADCVDDLLVDKNAVMIRNDNGQTPVELAAEMCSRGVLLKFHEAGVSLHEVGWEPPFLTAVVEREPREEIVHATCGEVVLRDFFGRTVLHVAADFGEVQLVRAILDMNPGLIHAIDYRRQTALHKVIRTSLNETMRLKRNEVCQLLLGRGADVERPDREVHGALHHSALSGTVEMTKMILERVKEVDPRDFAKRTPLMLAAGRSKTKSEKCRLMIEAGADVNAKDEDGWSPLCFAVQMSGAECGQMLLDAGAKVGEVGRIPWEVFMGKYLSEMDEDDAAGIRRVFCGER